MSLLHVPRPEMVYKNIYDTVDIDRTFENYKNTINGLMDIVSEQDTINRELYNHIDGLFSLIEHMNVKIKELENLDSKISTEVINNWVESQKG